MKKKAKIAFGKLNLLRNDQLNNKNKIKLRIINFFLPFAKFYCIH